MAKFTVRSHKWVDGALQWAEFHFGSHIEAYAFANKVDCHVAKIIASDGSITNEIVNTPLPLNSEYI